MELVSEEKANGPDGSELKGICGLGKSRSSMDEKASERR